MLFQYQNEPEGELEHKPPDRHRVKTEKKDEGESEIGDEEPLSFASPMQVINAMEEAFRNDKDLLNLLKGKALKLIRFYFRSNMMHDLTAEDVVDKALKPLISGKRKWYPDKVPDIVELMFMVLYSFIRNERKKKKERIVGLELYSSDGELCETNIIDLQRAYLREDLMDPELSLELENNIERLFVELENDTIAYFVLEEYLEIDHNEIKKPETYIAEKLQVTVLDVKNAVRRIKRRIKKIMETK